MSRTPGAFPSPVTQHTQGMTQLDVQTEPPRQWGPCRQHSADLPCPRCQRNIDEERGGRPLIVRVFICTTCGDPCNVRQYREPGGGLSVDHADRRILARHQHPPTDT